MRGGKGFQVNMIMSSVSSSSVLYSDIIVPITPSNRSRRKLVSDW